MQTLRLIKTTDAQTNVRIDKKPRLLLVDDQLSLLHSLQALLRINGYDCDLALSVAQALDLLQKHSYQFAVVDLQMPGGDGFSLLEYIGREALEIEVIVLSGVASFSNVKEALRLGAFDFVRKPCRPEELLSVLKRGVEHQRVRRNRLNRQLRLSQSERIHRLIVNNSPDLIYILDDQGRFSYVNGMAREMLGYRRSELLGEHFSRILHPCNGADIHNFFSEQRAGDRATRSVDARLRGKPASDDVAGLDNHELIVELSAIGLYERNELGQRVYAGTLGSARDITERKRLEEQISHQAYHDLLTRLPNRALFDDRLDQAFAHAKRSGQEFALIFMDLDRFKRVNDTLGHLVGDRVLQVVADRIRTCLRAEDTLCRFGGDEFALLLPDIDGDEGVSAVAEKILSVVRQPLHIEKHELSISASLGIALFPRAGNSRDGLLHSADVAMYQAKKSASHRYQFFSEAMPGNCSSSFIEKDLRIALETNQLHVHFQPRVDPGSHTLIRARGAAALAASAAWHDLP